MNNVRSISTTAALSVMLLLSATASHGMQTETDNKIDSDNYSTVKQASTLQKWLPAVLVGTAVIAVPATYYAYQNGYLDGAIAYGSGLFNSFMNYIGFGQKTAATSVVHSAAHEVTTNIVNPHAANAALVKFLNS
jgi:hypothetical protein